MGTPKGDLKPEPQGTQARRSPSPRAPSPRAPEDNDDASAAGGLSPAIAYRIKTPGQALHEAVTRKDLDGVTRILRASPDIVDAKNDRGRTPLHVAAQWGLNEIVKVLISEGADIGARSRWKYVPLHFAAESYRHDVVMTLLDSGADLELGTRDGNTPLHKAVMKEVKNKQDLLAILLIRGANCNAFNNEGSTPLEYAMAHGNLSNARALCAFGADPYFKDKKGENAFDYAKRLENNLGGEMAEVLAKWEKCGKQTLKILPQLSKFITKKGRVDLPEMLSWVSGLGHEGLVEFILDYMAKDTPQIVDSEGLRKGWRPIHHAAWAGQSRVAEILLAHGCAVDATTGVHKWTPLHAAAAKGRQRTLTVLLDNGADILAKAELNPPWRIDAGSRAQKAVLLTKATAFWLAAGERHPKSLDVLRRFALGIEDDNRRITAMDDYTRARQYLANLTGQDDDSDSDNDDSNSIGRDPKGQPVVSPPSLLPEINVSGTGGSFDGAFFSVQATSLELSHSDAYQKLLSVWDNIDFKRKDRRIKVAILDTGLDVAHQNFQNPRLTHFVGGKPVWSSNGEDSQYDRIMACEDFTGDGPIMRKDEMKDLDGHGTQVAELILRIAPRSELYIARICEGEINRGTATPSAPTHNPVKQPHPSIVAKAIDWAREQKVDIINMSFGFQESYRDVKAALNRAVRDSKILVFAAMSNNGRNSEYAAWPARDPYLTIGVHSCDEYGHKSSLTPDHVYGSHNFMFVGEQVITQWPEAKGGGFRLDKGTSFSTPAVAAMAALILSFAWQTICKNEREEAEQEVDLGELRELGGMGKVLDRISKKDDHQLYSYIYPLLLWKGFRPNRTDDDRTHKNKVKEHAWKIIVDSLRL